MWLSFATDPGTGKVKFVEHDRGVKDSRRQPIRHSAPNNSRGGAQHHTGLDEDSEDAKYDHRESWSSHGHVEL